MSEIKKETILLICEHAEDCQTSPFKQKYKHVLNCYKALHFHRSFDRP